MQNRIKQLRKSLGLNQAEFGARLGVVPSAISNYENGSREVSDAMVISICREFGVSETWLRTGAGEMRADTSREEELGRLLGDLLADEPESFRTAFITVLLRFPPGSPQWALLEQIYRDVAAELEPETKKDLEP